MKKGKNIKLLSDYMVNIAQMAESGISGYCHLVKIPRKVLDEVDTLDCILHYPFKEIYCIRINIEKYVDGKYYILYVDPILLAISKAYEELDEKELIQNHTLADLWIEGLELAEGKLIVYVGS